MGGGGSGKAPHLKGGLVPKPRSLGNFCCYIAYVPHPKPRIRLVFFLKRMIFEWLIFLLIIASPTKNNN